MYNNLGIVYEYVSVMDFPDKDSHCRVHLFPVVYSMCMGMENVKMQIK